MFIVPNSVTLPPDVQAKVVELVQGGYLRVVEARVLYMTPEAKTLLTPPERSTADQLAEFENFYEAIQRAQDSNSS